MLKQMIIVLLLVFSLSLAGDGWIIYTKDSEGETTKTYTDGRRISTYDGESEFKSIIDLNTMQLTMVNENDETYWQGTLKEFSEETARIVNEAQEKALASVPEAYRDQMKSMMGMGKSGKPAGKAVLEKAGSEKINNYNSDKYLLKVGGKVYQELWVSDELPFWPEMSKYTKKISEEELQHFGENEMLDELKLDFPAEYFLLNRDYYTVKNIIKMENPMMGGSMTFADEIVNVENKSLDENLFTVPAGYKKTDLKDFIKMDMGEEE